MAYEDVLVDRTRRALAARGLEIDERELLGGLMFYASGHMLAGVINDQLVLRLSPDAALAALARKSIDAAAEPEMPGIISVSPAGYEEEADLQDWINLAVRSL